MADMSTVSNNVHYSLFKGEPGTRKSTTALSYPKPQYWFSFDQKMNALTIPMRKLKIDPKLIEYDDYTEWSIARQKMEGLQANCKYKTLVIDSVTSVADYMLRQVIKGKGGVTRGSGQAAGKVIGGIPVNELEDFNAESAGLTELIALTKDIQRFHKIDVILIAHVIRTEMKAPNGVVSIARTIVTAGKKPAAKIPAYCDETYHFFVESDIDVSKGGQYAVLTSNVGEEFARTTLDLPTKIILGESSFYDGIIKPAIEKQKQVTI